MDPATEDVVIIGAGKIGAALAQYRGFGTHGFDVVGVDTALTDRGGADEIHGESGDDFIYGLAGNDVLFGEGQDDDIIGGYGNDWISGGTGRDGRTSDRGRALHGSGADRSHHRGHGGPICDHGEVCF